LKENVIIDKTFRFSVGIVKLFRYLTEYKKEFVLSKQLLKCGTSIGANVEEAVGGLSRKDFIAKLQIAYKESRETKYWLKLLRETGYIDVSDFSTLDNDLEEITKILISILNSSKKDTNNPLNY
jgi:four helix bundle protein